MRIIPKNTKVATEFFTGVSSWDIVVGAFGFAAMFFVVISSLPYKLGICGAIAFVFAFLLVRIDDEPNYMYILRIIQHFSYVRHYKKQNKSSLDIDDEQAYEAAEQFEEEEEDAADSLQEEKGKRRKAKQRETSAEDIARMFLIEGIHDDVIDYGTYFGAVLEIPAVEFRFFSPHRRTNSIDSAMANVIRNVGSRYSANIVKLERPMVLDRYLETEREKIAMLRKGYENGVYSDEELKARLEVIYHRMEKLEILNSEDPVLIPHYYLALFDSDKRQLENQIHTAQATLKTGEMHPERLTDIELVAFLKYTNSVDFDEREIENLHPTEYADYLMPDSLDFTQRTVLVNNIITHNFRVSRYPLNVDDAWGARLFDIPGTKVVVKFSQMDQEKSIKAIDRSLGELNSQLSRTNVSSKIIDLQTHMETLSELLVMLQNNNESLIAMNIYVTAYDIASTRESKIINPQPPVSNLPRITGMKKDTKRKFTEAGFRISDQSFKQLETYVASQVNGYDPYLKQARGVPGSTLAGMYPWIYAHIKDEKGINLGSSDGVPTFFDFFRRDSERVNSNMVIVGKSGGGKSYATKSILSNLAADDSKIFVLDPENEYVDLAANLNGKYINVANATNGRINPFHIITSLEDDEAEEGQETSSFAAHLQFLEEFFRQILPEINSDAMEYLNNIINRVYLRKGIDQYTNLSKLKAEDYPIFDDLYDCILEEFQSTQSEYLKNNLRVLMNYVAKFSTGGRNAVIWNGPSSLSTVENFIVFNFQALLANRNNTIANAQMLMVLKYLDNEIIKNREYNIKNKANRKIIIVIDEAHVFIDSKYPIALDFMYQMAKRIRKYNGMQIVITQNIKDFVGSEELARKSTAIINACQYSFIFSLAPNDMHDLCQLYEKAGGINEVEQDQIMSAPRGQAFVVTGPTSRATMQIETLPEIEELFSQPEYTRRYYLEGESDRWTDFISENRKKRAINMLEDIMEEEILQENGIDGIFSKGGVTFIETEMVEEPQEEIILMEEEPQPQPQPEEEPQPEQKRENATSRAMDALSGDMPAAAQTTQGYFAQLGFEALVSEIRRTVKEEIKAEMGLADAVALQSAAAAAVPSGISSEEMREFEEFRRMKRLSKQAEEEKDDEDNIIVEESDDDDDDLFEDIFNFEIDDEENKDDDDEFDFDFLEDLFEISEDEEEKRAKNEFFEDLEDDDDLVFSFGSDDDDDEEEDEDEEDTDDTDVTVADLDDILQGKVAAASSNANTSGGEGDSDLIWEITLDELLNM